MIDTGCASYGIISSSLARAQDLKRIPIETRALRGFNGTEESIDEVACVDIDVGGISRPRAFLYVVKNLRRYDLILGRPWLDEQKAVIDSDAHELRFKNHDVVVKETNSYTTADVRPIGANGYLYWEKNKRRPRHKGIETFAVSMSDINKALTPKAHGDPKMKLPQRYHEYLTVFDRKAAETLPPLRGPAVDHHIDIGKDTERGEDKSIPWGPLYSMSRDELLVLRKTLTELLEKNFIRVSNSPAAAPVLFVKKPGGGLRFCVDYRALNTISRKDRYPLPLVNETLERIGKAQYFTKLDIISAFHQIRVAEGDEWKTAFRTRYGLYEWLVTPFGLANAPSTFQRYINWILREYLDIFCSAYVDDILIFSDDLRTHRTHVETVLKCLRDAGLRADIDKCEFEVQSTTYLGFIIEAGKGLRMDPKKVEAIRSWAVPTTVKGVRGFIGFANFYRRFIRNFSATIAPLLELTRTNVKFEWTHDANLAFNKLKDMFTKAPILLPFDPDRETEIETDASGHAVGGVLYQLDDAGLFRPCAYFSKKNTPAESNYPIFDKELLAIVKCLGEWDKELRSVGRFRVVTDHKNLEYFSSIRRLSERHMRWMEILNRFSFTIQYRPGSENGAADSLSRREQDIPANADDDRLKQRNIRLLSPEVFQDTKPATPLELYTTNHEEATSEDEIGEL